LLASDDAMGKFATAYHAALRAGLIDVEVER
jgi:hypothetical protein